MHIRICLALFVITGLCQAQISSTVSPPFAEAVPGNGSTGVSFGYPVSRTQQVDAHLKGAGVFKITSLAFRRSVIHSQAKSTGHGVEARIQLGHGKLASVQRLFDKNYKGSPTTVFDKKTVKLPSWSGPPSSWHPFDAVFKFDRPLRTTAAMRSCGI